MARDRAARPDAKSLRLFVAFEVPDEAQRAIDGAIAPLRERFPQARWVPTENRHVTLKFLGQTWPRLGGWVEEQVATVASAGAPVETRLTAVGSFPHGRRARVLWAGVDDPDGRLARLSESLDDALAGAFGRETRAYTPHVTVARSDPPLRLGDDDLHVHLEPVAFTVGRIVVFRSHLRRPAPRYEAFATFPLGG
ncbi:MAG TPA: RNA 2',3'-cyclic phosphodiesterase [Actinomycetota bacterium]|nr:RNA 2',3'-cyclic phosphodiesterase [Actinomycetota bacterium]